MRALKSLCAIALLALTVPALTLPALARPAPDSFADLANKMLPTASASRISWAI